MSGIGGDDARERDHGAEISALRPFAYGVCCTSRIVSGRLSDV